MEKKSTIVKVVIILASILFSFVYLKDLLQKSMEYFAIDLNFNYGISIIIVTLIIKIIMLAISFNNEVSNKKTQLLKSEFGFYDKELKKCKDDEIATENIKMKISELKLKYGIRSISGLGCLTMIFQIVIVVSWYLVIGESIHIHESKFLWFELGSPDRLIILPTIFMFLILTNFYINGLLETKLKVFFLMGFSILVFFIGLNIAGGLFIYLLTNLVFTLVKDISILSISRKLIKNADSIKGPIKNKDVIESL